MPTVLILGATSDMGYAIAKRFAAEGYDVQLAARNAGGLGPFQSDLQIRHNIRCTTHHFDVLDYAGHESFYHSLSPRPDVTVCVVGYMADNEKVIRDPAET